MQIHISQNILDMIFDLQKEGEIECDRINNLIFQKIAHQFSLENIDSIYCLREMMSQEIKNINDYKNLYDFVDFQIALDLLLKTYENILQKAVECGFKTILVPALGTGSYGFTHEDIARKVIKTITKFFRYVRFSGKI